MTARYFTGMDGALLVNSNRVAKIISWVLNASVELLETTVIDAQARTYVFGHQQWSGSCVALYYKDALGDLDTQPLLANTIRTSILSPTTTHTLELQLTTARVFEATVLINSASIKASNGNAVEVEIEFTVTGLPIDATMGAA
jgi:hypothetical protein